MYFLIQNEFAKCKNVYENMLPIYLILMGIPSTLWRFLPSLNKKRKAEGLSYFSFFTEKWANIMGEKVTGQRSMENLVLD